MKKHTRMPGRRALALAIGLAFSAPAAYGAGLGRITVQSGLGQPLRAEVEVTAVSREEAASLAVRMASAAAFRQANLDYNPALTGLRVSIGQRTDSGYVVRLSSPNPVNEPAGQGKTAGRGTKGQGARSGGGSRLYHQGGNLPFYRRLPFLRGEGFTPLHRIEYNEVNLDQLGGLPAESEVNPTTLAEARLLRKLHNPVVILGRGNVEVPLKVRVQRVSKSAQAKIEAAGGSVEIVE